MKKTDTEESHQQLNAPEQHWGQIELPITNAFAESKALDLLVF